MDKKDPKKEQPTEEQVKGPKREKLSDIAKNIQSRYQIDTAREISESLIHKLKKYLQGSIGLIGHINKKVKHSSKISSFLDLELDSIVCRQLFEMKLEVSRSMKKAFGEFEDKLRESIIKSFNVSQEEMAGFSLEKIASASVVPSSKPRPVQYESFEKFLADIPSMHDIMDSFQKDGNAARRKTQLSSRESA